VNELEFPGLYEAAARAAINERCAAAFLHDIRGSMQALFSALELLGRSAQSGANPMRIEKACDLARRAISHHEKSTMGVLQILTLQHEDPTAVEVGELMREVVHFLRNDVANRDVTVKLSAGTELWIVAERARLQTLLVGLMTATLDIMPTGSELELSIDRRGADAVVTLGSHAAVDRSTDVEPSKPRSIDSLGPRQLILLFAHQYLAAKGGHLEIDEGAFHRVPDGTPHGTLRLFYPCSVPGSAPTRAPDPHEAFRLLSRQS